MATTPHSSRNLSGVTISYSLSVPKLRSGRCCRYLNNLRWDLAQSPKPVPKLPHRLRSGLSLPPTLLPARQLRFQAVLERFPRSVRLRGRILPLLVGFVTRYLGRRKARPGWDPRRTRRILRGARCQAVLPLLLCT